MSTLTSFLKLAKPGRGEYTNTWDIPTNDNLDKIDTWAQSVDQEIANARGTQSSLKAFLDIGHNTDGTLKPTSEVIAARNSYLYGNKTGTTAYDLALLALQRDKEVWAARGNSSSLRDAIGYTHSFFSNMTLSGTTDTNGYPSWCTFISGNKVQVDGRTKPVLFLINGKVSRVRTLKEVTISGSAGTYYVYADYQADGVQTVGDISGSAGLTPDTSELRLHEDVTKDYSALDVQVGDVLRYVTPTTVAGDYLVAQVGYGAPLDYSQLLITGLFPSSSGSITYQIRDPLAVNLGFAATETAATGRHFFAEVDFDGANITAIRPRAHLNMFVGEWKSVDVGAGDILATWKHAVGSTLLDVVIQVSQGTDGTYPIEELSLAQISKGALTATWSAATMGVAVTDGKTFTPSNGTLALSPNTPQSLVGTVGGALGGTVTAALSNATTPTVTLSGDPSPLNSVKMKYDRNQIWVTNVVAGKFYTDYAGAAHTTGYIRVLITKKG